MRLYQQLTKHFSSLERRLTACSETLHTKHCFLDMRTSRRLEALRRREVSIDGSVSLALLQLDSLAKSGTGTAGSPSDAAEIAEGLRSFCASMDSSGFFTFVVSRRKEVDTPRAELPDALKGCVDPARFVMDEVSEVFPINKRAVRTPTNLAWVCMLILEAVLPALADPDPEIGVALPMVLQAARGMAREWKDTAERKGGVECAKPPDAHAFLQHVVTFAVAEKDDKELYRRVVMSFSWWRHMPRLAITSNY